MLVEMDDGKDVSNNSDQIALWRAQTDIAWKSVMISFLAAGKPTSSEEARAAGFSAAKNVMDGFYDIHMEFPYGNDDRIGAVKRVMATPGNPHTVPYVGDGGNYKIRFTADTS